MPEAGTFRRTASADEEFVALARAWMANPPEQFLGVVWQAYDKWCASPPAVDPRDLERSISQLLEPRVRDVMSGDEPFYVQHGPFERETMQPPPAQPPEYDLAFVFRADERIMWPMEAKVLETPGTVADYVRDIREEYLKCRYGPFSASGAMLGYLLTGDAEDALRSIACRLECALRPVSMYPRRPNRVSAHTRIVPPGKAYPREFECYHMILGFPGLRRSKSV